MGFPPLLNLSTRLSTAAWPGQTTKTAQTLEFMLQNVAYWPTVYRTGVFKFNDFKCLLWQLSKWLKWVELFQPNTIYIRNHSAMMILNYFIWSVIKAKKILFLLKWNSNLCWRNSNDGLKSLEQNFSSYV